MNRFIVCLFLCGFWPWAAIAEEPRTRVLYIANMGAMIERGETKIVFDPLFRNDYGTYDPVPVETEVALMAGLAPWDGIDAVFISHHHGDHFDPATILQLLKAQPAIELFGPEQAAAAIRELVTDPENPVLKRVHGLSLENGMTATDVVLGPLLVEAARIRHSGKHRLSRNDRQRNHRDAFRRCGSGRWAFRD
jgi:L-ascorbate metabolism protein UlaG (beta-lactamase superfamily)